MCTVDDVVRLPSPARPQNGAGVSMSEDGPWLNLPQAVVLEATRDIKLVQGLTDNNPALLVIKANQRVAVRIVIPLEANADNEHRREAVRRARAEVAAVQDANRYLEAQKRVHQRLLAGVRTKASRTPGGPCESVDLVEFTRVELRGVDAIDKRTETVMLYDLRINGSDLVEDFWGKSKSSARADASDEPGRVREHSSKPETWDCAGDPLPKLIAWARSRWGEDTEKLPNRQELLSTFREQFGQLLGINEKSMREVRRQLASQKARRGGAPTHRG